MYELIKINDNDYYIDSPSKAGIVKVAENEVILIDAGNDKGAGKKIKKALDSEGWTLRAIYATHSHADHIGGIKYLTEQTGCKVYARGSERAFTEHTELLGGFLYGGFTPSELRGKFMLADAVSAEHLTDDVLPDSIKMIALPGHSFDMVGFITRDKTFFVADSLSSRETLDKYKIGLIYDVKEYLSTLEKIKEYDARLFVPAHAPVTESITALADYNIATTEGICERICDTCDEPTSFEEILKKLFDSFGLFLSFEQYAIVGSTVRSYLTYLKESGKIKAEISDNRLLWTKIKE